jgi:hypothetical protein
MANVKNFGLIGVGSDLQLGKAGTRLINNAGTFNFKAANGTTDAALTSAGITSSAGDVTLTTGNVVLSDTAGTFSIGGDTSFSRQGAGVFSFDGTKAFVAPVGDTAGRTGLATTGMVRVNNDAPAASFVEYYNGTTWKQLATGGDAAALQLEVDAIEASLGTMVSSAGVWNNAALSNVTVWPTPPANLTAALNTMAALIVTDNSLEEIFPATGPGNVIYANALGTGWLQDSPGATSGVQAYDLGLTNLAAKTSTGLMVQLTSDTYQSVALLTPGTGLAIGDPSGLAGGPSFTVTHNLAAIEGLSNVGTTTFGYIALTADGAAALRTFGQGTGISLSDPAGTASNTDISLATLTNPATGGTFVKITSDAYGRVSNSTPVVSSDIYNLVDSRYVQLAGSTMDLNANITFNGGDVRGLPPVPATANSATSKTYVDNMVSGLQWKNSVNARSPVGTNVSLTGSTPLVVGGETILDQESVLLNGQTVDTENGIYLVTITGGSYALTRRADSATYGQLIHASVFVSEGTYANTGWTQTNEYLTSFAGQVWVQFSGAGAYVAGSGINISGTTISTVISNGLKYVNILGQDALTLDIAGALALNDAGGPLTLQLDPAGGLTQTAVAGYLGIKANGVTNGMLANASIALNADSGTGTVALGGTLLVEGTSAQGISTVASGATFTITAADATTSTQKGVARFTPASFTATSGLISLNTVDVGHGGTGQTTLGVNMVMIGNGSGAVITDAGLTYVSGATDTLTLGGATGGTFAANGTDLLITSTGLNSNIVLTPDGTGAVVIGPAGAGLLQSDAGTPLTVQGNTTLTLSAVTGNVIVAMPTGMYVNVSGPTAAAYAAAIASVPTALTNKQYVDNAITAGSAAGSVKAFQAVVPLNANAVVAIGTAIPANSTILSVKVLVGVADASATLSVGYTGSPAIFMNTGENDAQSAGMYMAETFTTWVAGGQVNATVASSTGTGSGTATVIFTYQVAQ